MVLFHAPLTIPLQCQNQPRRTILNSPGGPFLTLPELCESLDHCRCMCSPAIRPYPGQRGHFACIVNDHMGRHSNRMGLVRLPVPFLSISVTVALLHDFWVCAHRSRGFLNDWSPEGLSTAPGEHIMGSLDFPVSRWSLSWSLVSDVAFYTFFDEDNRSNWVLSETSG